MPPWNDIDTVMFDMDGTLLDLHFDNYFWQHLLPLTYAEQNRIAHDEAIAFVTAKSERVYGTLDWYCLDYWRDELGVDISGLKTSVKHKISVRPNVEELLQKLELSEKRVLLVTNAHPSSLQIKMEQTGISHYFDQCLSSHTLKLAKENHGFWESLQSLEKYNPERTVLFDDSLPVLRQARREGIKHLFGIKKPDSKKPVVLMGEFLQIDDFSQIMPPQSNGSALV